MNYKKFTFLAFIITIASLIFFYNSHSIEDLHHNQRKIHKENIIIVDLDATYFNKILSNLNTKPILLILYASWCKNCIVKFSEIKKIIQEYNNKINYVIISLDENKKKLHSFLLKQKEINFIPYNVQHQHLLEIIYTLQSQGVYFNGKIPYIALLDQKMSSVIQELDITQIRNHIRGLL